MTRTPLLALAALAALAPAAHAQIVAEGNAGQTLSTFQDATATAVTQINGTIAPTAGDADLYRLYVSSPATFSATTINAATAAGGVDTALFLLDATGHAVATNDDGSNVSFDAALPAGNPLYKNLPAGFYFLGISSSGNEPANSANQRLFLAYPGGDSEAVRGPASGLNPTTLNTFDGFEFDTTTVGAYQIDLTGVSAAAPEPSAWAALLVGAVGLGALTIRARRRAA